MSKAIFYPICICDKLVKIQADLTVLFFICDSSSVSLIYVFVLVLLHAVFITTAWSLVLQHFSFYSGLVWVVRNLSASVWILRFFFCIYVKNDHWNFDGDCFKECRLLLVLAIFSFILQCMNRRLSSILLCFIQFFLYFFFFLKFSL